MYDSLESRVFDSYLRQTPNEFVGSDDGVVGADCWLALYNWTRNVFRFFANNPQLLVKDLHDDCDLPGVFGTYSTLANGTKIKTWLRKAIVSMNGLLQFVWDSALAGECNGDALTLPADYKIAKKHKTLLEHTGIILADNSLIAADYIGMFSALKALTKQADDSVPTWCHQNGTCSTEFSGYRRFVRCMYGKSLAPWFDIFGDFSGDVAAFKQLTSWLKDNDFQEGIWLDTSNGKSFESSGISYKKNITGVKISDGNIYLYDHDHIGFWVQYSVIRTPAQSFHLTVQNPRLILSSFESLPLVLQNFIAKYHARCHNCGYCTMRSKGKQNPYTITAKFNGETIPFCPIHHVYSYSWSSLDDEKTDGLIAYLQYLQTEIPSVEVTKQ
jgi:hypothetical protein